MHGLALRAIGRSFDEDKRRSREVLREVWDSRPIDERFGALLARSAPSDVTPARLGALADSRTFPDRPIGRLNRWLHLRNG